MKNWVKVRHIPDFKTFEQEDLMSGTETYGDPMESKQAWAIKFDINNVDRVYVRSNNEHQKDTHLKEYKTSEISQIFTEDELLSSQEKLKHKKGASVYVEFKDQPFQIIGVHNGFSDFKDGYFYCGTIITNHLLNYFIKPAIQVFEISYKKKVRPNMMLVNPNMKKKQLAQSGPMMYIPQL